MDYDLLKYSTTADTTGSRLAYLLRCFSKCGFIIVLNEYGPNPFDMSLGNPADSFADINVGAVQIGNPGLWGPPLHGYRPWYWPVIPEARKNFEKCVKDVQDNLNGPSIIEFLGLDRVIDQMPQRARTFLSGRQRIDDITFSDFAKFKLGGIAPKDTLSPEHMARVVAARIGAWLNSIILPEQSVLVDAPHLVSRFPSLITSGREDINVWNRLCNPIDGEIDDLLADSVRGHKFRQAHWLWRPAWYWPEVNRNEYISEVRDPWSIKEMQWVFCENISRFAPVEFAKDFRASVSPPFIKRFVFKSDSPDALDYIGAIEPGTPQDPSQVDYVPQAAFSL